MKLAVIIPYKNAAEWLPRCLDSCYTIDGSTRIRFLMVNDGSADASKDIALDYDHTFPNFEAYDNENRPGVSGARNTGLDHLGDADWFTFLDSDDIMKPEAYYEIQKAISDSEDTNADLIQFNHLRQYSEAIPIMKHYEPAGWRPLNALPKCWIPVWNKVYRSKTLRHVRYPETMQFGEDEIYNINILHRARGIYCSEGVTIIRRFPNPESLSKTAKPEDLEQEVAELFALATYCGLPPEDPALRDVVLQRIETLKTLPRYDGIFEEGGKT